MRLHHLVVPLIALASAIPAARAEDAIPTSDEIKKLVDAAQYRDALKALTRAIALRGTAAAGYDRVDLFMLRAECQLQIKDQQATLASLDSAKKQAFEEKRFDKLPMPTAMAALLQKSSSFKYTPKGAKEPISILDRTLRPAAFVGLFADQFPIAKQKCDALNNAKTLGPVEDAAKIVGEVRALEIVSKPDGGGAKPSALESTALSTLVTTNADRLMSAALADFTKQTSTISSNANQIIHDSVAVYDPMSKKSWLQPRVRRRGPSDQEVQTLNAIIASCDKMHAECAALAATLATDFDAYQGIVNKATAERDKAAAVLNDNYLAVPP